MPGNEVGDRVHNFLDQGSLSQDQRHTQFVDANWRGFHNNVLGANERQIGGPLNTSSKNYSGQQSEIGNGQNNPFSLASHELNFSQSGVRPEFIRSPSQVQQQNLNGFMHTPQVVNDRQNGANLFGVDRRSDRLSMTSRGLFIPDSQQQSIPQRSSSASFGVSETPMNNFFGGQQQMSGQQSGMMLTLPQQQSGVNDAQLMHQQVMFRQMQELQRRQQFQQFEAMQRNAMNHMSTFPNQSAGQHSQAINGNPVQDTSSHPWQTQVMASGTNWQQHGHPSAAHGYPNGLMAHPEQGQAMHFMGSTPQQASQSLYGVPVSNSAGTNLFLQNSMDKQGVSHASAQSSAFSLNPHALHAEQASMQDMSTTSRSGSEGKTSFEHASSHGLEREVDLGGFNQVQQREVSMSESGGNGFVGGSDVSPEKPFMQIAVSQSTSAQGAAGLDPTEEKILFGNDDNIWDAFGGASVTGNDGADLFNGFPSMQSGTWSALMQSAVAETSSSDVGTQEEWSGLESQHNNSQVRNQHLQTSQDNDKQQPVWVDSSQRAALGSRITSNEEGRRWLDSNLPKPHTEGKRALENPNSPRDLPKIDTGFWGHQQSIMIPESVPDSTINSKVESGEHGLRTTNISSESSQMHSDNHRLNPWKQVNFGTKSGIVGSGNGQQIMNKDQLTVENGDGRENSNDSHSNSFPYHSLSGCSEQNVWSDTGRKVPVARKFQYHPMGDVDLDESSAKEVLQSHSMSPSSGHRAHEAQPSLHGPTGSSLSHVEKGRASGFPGGSTMFHGGSSTGVRSGYFPNMSTPFVRPGENSSPNQYMPPSQNMLELLHKVDQSTDQNVVSNLGSSSTNYNRSPDIPSDGHVGPGQSQSSLSNSFNLQLAPPSQGIAFSSLNDPAQGFSRNVGSPGPQVVSSQKGDNSHSRLALGPSAQGLPPSHRPPQIDSGNDKSGVSDGSLPNMKGNLSASIASNSTYLRNPNQNQHMTAGGGQMMGNHQSTINPNQISNQHTYLNQQSIVNQNQFGTKASMHQIPPQHSAMAGVRKDNMSLGGSYLRTSQQQLLGVQARSGSDFMKSHYQSNDSSVMNSFSQQNKDMVDDPKITDAVSFPGVQDGKERTVTDPQLSGKTAGLSQEESLERRSMEASPSNSSASQNDADAFQHSLKPNNAGHHGYSLYQMQALKTMGMDTSHLESKTERRPENGPDFPQMAGKEAEGFTGAMNSMVSDPSVDAKMLGFIPQSGNRNVSQLMHGRSDPRAFITDNATGRAQLTGISPQMAPSWFEQYGTLRNGQLPVNNVPRVPIVKHVEQQFSKPPNNLAVHNSAQLENVVGDSCQIADTSQITNAYSASEHMSSGHASLPHISSPSPVPMRPRKRKTATSDLIPWNKEIGQGFKRIQNISSAEVDWAQSSSRLVEKGGDDTDCHEDMSPMIRPRRRLILTTKLMQQVFCPPSAPILSLDGRSNYEAIMYSVARLALGDACNLICSSESDSPCDDGNSLSGKVETSERNQDEYFSKVVETFANRGKELENELLRLDKNTSILDFRLDCQDLERFSVINRFARFHGRTQADCVETSSSSDPKAVPQKPLPQRYVTALPMPRIVPERVQCLTIN
ncbi:hypothetical protein RND81_02G037800 [Saponaria officinalis]|uniref:Dentin sialophosphoprotein-like protein n=2 Tax=Saponaria officinalis TaxID=3572 RepID=A0AAW1MPT5_SAPOF